MKVDLKMFFLTTISYQLNKFSFMLSINRFFVAIVIRRAFVDFCASLGHYVYVYAVKYLLKDWPT